MQQLRKDLTSNERLCLIVLQMLHGRIGVLLDLDDTKDHIDELVSEIYRIISELKGRLTEEKKRLRENVISMEEVNLKESFYVCNYVVIALQRIDYSYLTIDEFEKKFEYSTLMPEQIKSEYDHYVEDRRTDVESEIFKALNKLEIIFSLFID